MSLDSHIDRWLAAAPQKVDLTKPAQDDWVRAVADELVALVQSYESLLELEDDFREVPVSLQLALKLACSKKLIAELKPEARVSIVFAVYKEHSRLRTRAEHPHGEDLLVRKVGQVEWLLFIYLWKRLIPRLSPIVDTQCGFKAFRADVAKPIVTDTVEKRFAFDIELLLRTELARSGAIARVPIAWIDSEAASTTRELQPYLRMLRSIVLISKRYLPTDPEAAGFASLIDSLDEDSWLHLSCNVPSEIAEREPSEFDAFEGVSAEDLARVARAHR